MGGRSAPGIRLFATCFLLSLSILGCQDSPPLASDNGAPLAEDSSILVDPELAAMEIMNLAEFPLDSEAQLPDRLTAASKMRTSVLGWEREELAGDVVHYSFILRVGLGSYDKIKLHRVVKERIPGRPVRTDKNIFLQHGHAVGFVKFLFGPAAPSAPDDHAAASSPYAFNE